MHLLTSGYRYALAFCLSATLFAQTATAVDSPTSVFATSFFPPAMGDPDPTLAGVLEVDLATGDTTVFIAESAATGFQFLSDVAVDEGSNTLYVSTLTGFVFRFDAETGAPLDSLVPGPPGAFAALPLAEVQAGNGFNSLLIEGGTLFAATAFGNIEPFDLQSGGTFGPLTTGLAFPSGMSATPDGAILVSTGDPLGGPGSILRIDSGGTTTLVDFTATPGVRGASNPTVVLPEGDYDLDGDVDAADIDAWADAFAGHSVDADGNGDGAVNAADYTVARDQAGEEARIVVADLFGNQLLDYALDGSDGQQLAVIPPDIPDPLPPLVTPGFPPSNFPSEVLVTDQGTLLVSTLGLTNRPDNRGALLEFDRDGTLLRTIASDLPPLSGIAFSPRPIGAGLTVPEPSAVGLAALVFVGWAPCGRRSR